MGNRAMFGPIDPTWPESVRDRLAELSADDTGVNERCYSINVDLPPTVRRQLLHQAIQSTTNQKRIFWLRREADLLNQAAMKVTACGTGCSHCCHSSVMLVDSEALAIGREIGRAPYSPPEGKYILTNLDAVGEGCAEKADALAHEFTGDPCPFLDSDSKCSIYNSRPFACREQINLDRDDLLCRLVPGATVPVPYLDVTTSKVAYIAAFGMNRKMADIRYFFPRGKTSDAARPSVITS